MTIPVCGAGSPPGTTACRSPRGDRLVPPQLSLADALRGRGLYVNELVAPLDPTPVQVAALAYAVRDHDLVIVGAEPSGGGVGRSGSVPGRSVVRADPPVIAVALREPFDLERYPEAPLCACNYGTQPPQMEALADALLGRIPFAGTLPVAVRVPA